MSASPPDLSPTPPAKTGGPNYPELIFRAVIIALLVFSVWLVWWSYYRVYTPRLKAARDSRATVSQLSAEVDDLDHRWPPADMDRVNQRFDLVDARLFADQSTLEAWLADFREQLPPLGLDLKATFQKTVAHTAAERNVLVIPTTLLVELRPVTNALAMPSSYQRLLWLTQQLVLQQKRADITDLTVDSGTSSIARAVIGLNFWAGEKEAK